MKQYYEFLVEHKISPYDLPVDILSDEADKYMSDPRVTSFVIPYYGDDARLVAAYEKVQSNPEWAKKGYFYAADEPDSDEDFANMMKIKERLDRLCPGYSMVIPVNSHEFTVNGKLQSSVDLNAAANDRICGISVAFEHEEYRKKLADYVSTGEYQPWWYVCCGSTGDYCNLFVHQEGIRHRILFWQQKDYNVDGLLYWSTTYWWDINYNPWADTFTGKQNGENQYGDGSLLYNGNGAGIDGPVGSLRLEGVTNGLEDFDYLTIAEELFGREYVDKTIDKVTKDLTSYTFSDEKLSDVRIELGNTIEKAMG